MDIWMMIGKLLIGLVCLIIAIRILGKKELAEASPLDVVYAVALGDLVIDGAYDEKIKAYEIILAVGYWTLFIYLIDRLSKKFGKFSKLVKGKPEVLIVHGAIDRDVAKRNRLSDEEIDVLLRQKDIFDIGEVKIGVLETNGALSICKH